MLSLGGRGEAAALPVGTGPAEPGGPGPGAGGWLPQDNTHSSSAHNQTRPGKYRTYLSASPYKHPA